MFGKIEEDTIYLLNSCNGFDRIDVVVVVVVVVAKQLQLQLQLQLEEGDAFTKKAQKAYNLIR